MVALDYVVPLASTSVLTANYPFPTGFTILSVCSSAIASSLCAIVPLFSFLPILSVSLSLSLPLSPSVLLVIAVFLGT